MTERLIFLDTETGGLRHNDRPWEVALIVDQEGQPLEQHVFHIADFCPSTADPKALELSGFYDRHPMWAADRELAILGLSGPDLDLPVAHQLLPEVSMVAQVERLTRRSVVIGCNAGFDTFRILEQAYARHGYAPTWHYRPLCATTYAASRVDEERASRGEAPLPLPWNNEAVGAALGVGRDAYGTLHSALGDAHYARQLFRVARGVWESV